MVDVKRTEAQLVLHEGERLTPYTDTLGNETVLVGYNVTARGWEQIGHILDRRIVGPVPFTHDDAMAVLDYDIARVQQAVRTYAPWYDALNEVRQRVCVDLAFNIGLSALGFKHTIAAVKTHDWSDAAVELHKAHWATQVEPSADVTEDAAQIQNDRVRGRADRLAKMLLTGNDYTE